MPGKATCLLYLVALFHYSMILEAGGVVYLDGYNSTPVLLKKGVSPHSNNYTGELVGFQ